MKYELSASPFVLEISGARDNAVCPLGDPAVGIDEGSLYPILSLLLFSLAISRPAVSQRDAAERRFRLSHFTTSINA